MVAYARELNSLRESFKTENDKLAAELLAVSSRIQRIESDTQMSHQQSKNIVTIGTTDTRWIVSIVLAICGVIGYLIYVGGWGQHGGNAEPPGPIEQIDGNAEPPRPIEQIEVQ